jgi:hypothetical protein
MPFESIFSGKCFPASSVAKERFFSRVRFPMPFQVVLAIKGQGAQITTKWPLR